MAGLRDDGEAKGDVMLNYPDMVRARRARRAMHIIPLRLRAFPLLTLETHHTRADAPLTQPHPDALFASGLSICNLIQSSHHLVRNRTRRPAENGHHGEEGAQY